MRWFLFCCFNPFARYFAVAGSFLSRNASMSMQDKILAAIAALDAKLTAHLEADTAALAALQTKLDDLASAFTGAQAEIADLKAELEATGVIDDSTIIAAIGAVEARLS